MQRRQGYADDGAYRVLLDAKAGQIRHESIAWDAFSPQYRSAA
jgi:hypothetical protein